MNWDDPDEAPEPQAVGSDTALFQRYLAVGQLPRARSAAIGMLRLRPNDPAGHTSLALVELAEGRLSAAQHSSAKALGLDPSDTHALYVSAIVALRQGRFATSETHILTALQQAPDYAPLFDLYGDLLGANGRTTEELAMRRRALELDPDDAEFAAYYATALATASPRHAAESEDLARRAVALDPDEPNAHAALGCALVYSGRIPEAVRAFRFALQLDASNAPAMQGLATATMASAPLYRPLLWLGTRLAGLRSEHLIAVVMGLWALYRSIDAGLAGNPALAGLRSAVTYSYIGFCAYTWFAAPITRALLARRHPWLKDFS